MLASEDQGMIDGYDELEMIGLLLPVLCTSGFVLTVTHSNQNLKI